VPVSAGAAGPVKASGARAIYDRTALDDPSVHSHLDLWTAEGEQARHYPGELPMKFAVFDTQAVIMPLMSPGVSGVFAVIVRNRDLAATLELLFDTLWEGCEPLGRPAP
jgi:HTH-type transcriptional regulator, sugar sensing transcriptional regulator